MRKGDNREVVDDCVHICHLSGSNLRVAGASVFNRFRTRLRSELKKKGGDYQSVQARFQMSVEAFGYSVTAIRQYACDDECSTRDEQELFWGAMSKCLRYMYSKHRRAIGVIMNQLQGFSRN
jgi:hypothetical protein